MESPRRAWTGLFAKRPVAGHVKTRLTPPLSEAAAARLQAGMLADSVERLLAGAEHWEPVLAFAPATETDWFTANYPAVRRIPQQGRGLAQRMERFFGEAFIHASQVVMTGSDQPLVTLERLLEAHAALSAGSDLVLGPDAGGGYYLIGLHTKVADRVAPLFSEVQMSTASMFEATLEVARAAGLSTQVLPEEFDVDEGADLERLVTLLAATPYSSETEHTRAALCELGLLASKPS